MIYVSKISLDSNNEIVISKVIAIFVITTLIYVYQVKVWAVQQDTYNSPTLLIMPLNF